MFSAAAACPSRLSYAAAAAAAAAALDMMTSVRDGFSASGVLRSARENRSRS